MSSKISEIVGAEVQGKAGNVASASFSGAGKVVGIYFSAHWCPPCRGFTPALAKFYNAVKAGPNADKFEIVFVSMDRDQKSFDGYYGEMPWLAVPFSSDLKQTIPDKYGCTGIPMFVLLDADTGDVISKDGRSIVGQDPNGEKFPWK